MIHTTQTHQIGDNVELMREMEPDSIDTIITSPPYWGLRDYGVDGQIGLEPTLEEYHARMLEVTAECMRVLKPTGVMFWNHGDSYPSGGGKAIESSFNRSSGIDTGSQPDNRPSAKLRSQQGKCMVMQNERLIIRMIDEQGWVLRNRIIWNKPNGMPSSVADRFSNKYEPVYMLVKSNGTNYYYNSKTGAMQRDVPPGTKGEEGVDWDWKEVGAGYSASDTKIRADDAENLASPRARVYREKKVKKVSNWTGRDYWFDMDAVRVPHKEAALNRQKHKWNPDRQRGHPCGHEEKLDMADMCHPLGKNPGDVWDLKSPEYDWKQLLEVMSETVGAEAAISIFESYMQSRNVPDDVWTIPTQPYPESHFATFPTALIEPMIRAACPAEICPVCGMARTRIIEIEKLEDEDDSTRKKRPRIGGTMREVPENGWKSLHHTTGWTSCNCDAGWIAGTVLDPFYGSGTVGEVCRKLNRNAIGLELNPEYETLIKERSMTHTPPLTAY